MWTFCVLIKVLFHSLILQKLFLFSPDILKSLVFSSWSQVREADFLLFTQGDKWCSHWLVKTLLSYANFQVQVGILRGLTFLFLFSLKPEIGAINTASQVGAKATGVCLHLEVVKVSRSCTCVCLLLCLSAHPLVWVPCHYSVQGTVTSTKATGLEWRLHS